jgi:hypothetical protein
MNETFDAMTSDEITNEKAATVRKMRYLAEECLYATRTAGTAVKWARIHAVGVLVTTP